MVTEGVVIVTPPLFVTVVWIPAASVVTESPNIKYSVFVTTVSGPEGGVIVVAVGSYTAVPTTIR